MMNSNSYIKHLGVWSLTLILASIYLCVGAQAQANELASAKKGILLRSPSASENSYQAFLKLHPEYVSYINHLLKKYPSNKESKALKTTYLHAKRTFFTGESHLAIEAFQRVTGFALLADWKRSERKAIFNSYLRLSQFHKNEMTTTWLKRAACFAPDLTPNATQFHPRFRKNYSRIQKEVLTEKIDLSNAMENFPVILLNGRKLDLIQRPVTFVCPQKYRLTLLSNTHRRVVHIKAPSDLSELSDDIVPLVSGDCETPVFDPLPGSSLKTRAFFSSLCVKGINEAVPLKVLASTTTAPNSASAKKQNIDSIPDLKIPPPQNTKSWHSNSWVWWGLGGLATAIIVTHSKSKEKKSTQSTHHDGF